MEEQSAKLPINRITGLKSYDGNAPINSNMFIKVISMRMQKALCVLSLIIFSHANAVLAEDIDDVEGKSFHLGLMHPNGVDVAGYSVEKKFSNNIYSFYNFGFPSLAATGFSYYQEYNENGMTATAGLGIGFIMYGSVAYQWKIEQQHYFKFGAGLAAGVAYSGAFPVVSYEYRYKK